ncbi:MAG: hypothetical protein COB23_04235 [Methylophaga sp.]|nr:MAG: hypothetical protein COB23_04235 [Methylophaga sp.]
MKITVEYESSWRNSFLDGNNNEPLPKVGRKFIGSMTSLKNPDNFIKRGVTLDTVMGIINRLIGDQRKLYQSRNEKNYFFYDIEPLVSFVDQPTVINNEMTYIRNITGSTDQESYAGAVKYDDPIFISDYSQEFWGVLKFSFDELCQFIVNGTKVVKENIISPLIISEQLDSLGKIKVVENEGIVELARTVLEKKFPDINYLDSKNKIKPAWFYFSSLYLQLQRLEERFDVSSARTKAGVIKGISKKNFTKKNFMGHYSTGGEKKVWGNPYIHEEFIKGEGKTKHLMTKASGTLEIILNINRDKAKEIKSMIDNAGVSSFYLGKKGLAYVSNVSTKEEK